MGLDSHRSSQAGPEWQRTWSQANDGCSTITDSASTMPPAIHARETERKRLASRTCTAVSGMATYQSSFGSLRNPRADSMYGSTQGMRPWATPQSELAKAIAPDTTAARAKYANHPRTGGVTRNLERTPLSAMENAIDRTSAARASGSDTMPKKAKDRKNAHDGSVLTQSRKPSQAFANELLPHPFNTESPQPIVPLSRMCVRAKSVFARGSKRGPPGGLSRREAPVWNPCKKSAFAVTQKGGGN